jgi:galactokinase
MEDLLKGKIAKAKQVNEKFEALFDTSPLMVRSPGRINLIGEHTDYNEGFVLPAAIDKEIYFAFAKNGFNKCRIFSFDYEEMNTFSLDDFAPVPQGWINYVMGVVAQLQADGHPVQGFDCVFGGNIPIGAGLSSSAALENGVCLGLSSLFGLNLDKLTMIRYSQKAEHEYAGVACGIMDQFASMMGKAGHAIRLDCRSMEYSYFPLNLGDYQFILCDTKVEHALADSEYNQRRSECEIGLRAIQNLYSGIDSLRDVTFEMLDSVRLEVAQTVYDRCCYVLEENERLLQGAELLKKGDLTGFGKLMYGSHDGLSKKYQVSCAELDFLVDFTRDREEVLGARMMGGGFGGCTLNLVKRDEKEQFVTEISAAYKEQCGHRPEIYEVNVVDGTDVYPG